MLRSMTGFGAGQSQAEEIAATAEIRSVNNRGFKLSTRVTPPNPRLESGLEKQVRERIRRGSVQLTVQIAVAGDGERFSSTIDFGQVAHYVDSSRDLAKQLSLPAPGSLEPFLTLPGATINYERTVDAEMAAEAVHVAVDKAISALDEFRRTEGESIAADFADQLATLAEHVRSVADRAPTVVEEYREKLRERIAEVLDRSSIVLPEEAVVREVALFADKADVNEEVSRLGSHLEQFEMLLAADPVEGRKLDFLCQEIFREINTIGSKANDLQLAQTVVEMKSLTEKIREQVQNVE